MSRRKKVPSTVVDYDLLSPEFKVLYDKIAAEFNTKNIYQLRDEAIEMKIESPTTLGKEELVKRLTDRVISDFLPKNERAFIKPWELFKDALTGDTVKGLFEYFNGECRVGRVIVPETLVVKYGIREGDLVEGDIANAEGLLTMVNIKNFRYEKTQRRWFADIAPCARRPFDLIDGTKADKLMGGLHMGERVIVREMSVQDANEIASSFKKAIKLFIGLAPEYESNLDKGCFVSSFDLTAEETNRVVRLALEHAKRFAEVGEDVVLVVHGFDCLNNADLEHSLFGAGRCFDRGSLTIIAEMDKNRGNGAFARVATRIV